MVNDLAAKFASLFSGRTDAYGTDTGGCVRSQPPWGAHLAGTEAIGVYPAVHDYDPDAHELIGLVCRFGCVDFDIRTPTHVTFDCETEDEAHVAACNLQAVLAEFGVTAWIERTRSHGRHVWVFADQWVAARAMRRALLVASEIAGTPTREVNPKSETLREGQLGNYVRLPYPGGHVPDKTQTMVDLGGLGWYTAELFVGLALNNRTSPHTLQTIADLYAPPARSKALCPTAQYSLDGVALNAKGIHIFENGPNDGDRSRGLSYLARQCYESGLDVETAMMVLGNCSWNKYEGRSDETKRLMEIVRGAYG